MTKTKEEMAKEYSHRFDKGNKFNTTNSGGAYFEELAFLAGYDARQAEVDELQKYIDTPNPMELLFAKSTRETMCKFIKDNDELKSEIQALKKELDEQCRLNGIGASRELALMAQVNELLEFKKQAIKVVKFYGDRENWKFISYASDAKDVIRFDDVGCKSYCEDADFAIGSGGRRSREFLSKWGEK